MNGSANAHSFQRTLSRTVVLCIVVAVMAVTATTAWMVSVHTASLMRFQGTTMVTQFAQNSDAVLLVLTNERDTMGKEVAALARFPGVIAVDVLDATGTPVIQHGHSAWTANAVTRDANAHAVTVTEDARAWHFSAAITPNISTNPFTSAPPQPLADDAAGLVHIAIDKAPARTLVLSVIATGMVAALLISIAFVWWATRRIRTLTEPLSTLANVMSDFTHGVATAPVPLRGPHEVANIAQTFNALTARIAAQTDYLEETVAVRTRALRTARDRALNAEQHKSDVMALFSHEMRIPLHAIMSYVSHARRELVFLPGDTQTAHAHLDVVARSAEDLLLRINQILTLSRLDQGPMPIDLKPVDMPVFFDALCQALTPHADANHNAFVHHYHGPRLLIVDEDKLVQIVRNPLDNACKFTTHGDVVLSATHAFDELVITVSDTGIGVPKADQTRVFERFYQVDMSATRAHQGTGLGLAITHQFCRLLGGTLSLTSGRNNIGTRVSIRIPARVDTTACEPVPDAKRSRGETIE